MINNKYKYYLNRINDIIIDIDRNYIINYVNEADYRLRGFLPSELIGKSFATQVHPDDIVKYEKEYNIFLDSYLKNQNLEPPRYRIRLIKKDNSFLWVDLVPNLQIFHNEFAGAVLVCRDVSKEVENYQKLYETNEKLQAIIRQKDALFSVIAHDLRTPIHNFMYFSEFLFDKYDEMNPKDRLQLRKQMANSAKRLNELLENLLSWSQFQRGLIVPNFRQAKIFDLINRALHSIEEVANAKEITITNHCNQNLMVTCDENMIITVFRNIITNAIKFSYRGSAVDIYCDIQDQYIVISIQDYGKGIHPEIIPHLFEIGSKIGTIGTEGEISSGVGLSICRDFIQVHNGKIEVESELQKGSIFKIFLPLNKNIKNPL